MESSLIAIITMLALIGGIRGANKTCNTYTGEGCTSEKPFSFTYTGESATYNSLCRKAYRMVVNLPVGIDKFSCEFRMDVPEFGKYIYSISDSRSAKGASSTNAYIYGIGRAAYSLTRTGSGSIYYSKSINLHRAHLHPLYRHKSMIKYTLEDKRLAIDATSNIDLESANPYWFTPTSDKIYIGVNRRYAGDDSEMASGVCEVECMTYN